METRPFAFLFITLPGASSAAIEVGGARQRFQTLAENAKRAQDEAARDLGNASQMGFDDKKPNGNFETPPEALAPGAPAETSLPAIAAKADDLEEIKKAVEDAAAVSGGLWLSYLFVLSYIAIAAGAVTHEDLLLIRPVKLPFLNVELPLLAFFAVAPFVVLITHIYALMHFRMLGNKASRFHNELRRQIPAEGAKAEELIHCAADPSESEF